MPNTTTTVPTFRQLSDTQQVGTGTSANYTPPALNQQPRTYSATGVVDAWVDPSRLNQAGQSVSVNRTVTDTPLIGNLTNQWKTPDAFSENRLNNMLRTNSTYMNEARRSGIEEAATRGQTNSSIAAGAAQREAIRAAAPLAMQDAGYVGRLHEANLGTQLQDTLARNNLTRNMDQTEFGANVENQLANRNLIRDVEGRVQASRLQEQQANNALIRDFDTTQFRANVDNSQRNADLFREIERLNATGRIEDQQRANQLRREMDMAGYNADLTQQLRDSDAFRENWLGQESTFRSLYANAMNTQLGTNADMLSRLGEAFVNDPELYSPEVVQGMLNFFRGASANIINDTLSSVLGDAIGGGAVPPEGREGQFGTGPAGNI